MSMEKTYTPTAVEAGISERWITSGAFTPKLPKKGQPTFSIALPPPNVTGTLHVGHAMMLAIEDVLTRWHRMRGDATLWLPGTDHAGIATQTKVEKELAKKGLTRHALGREKFLEEVWAFTRDSQKTITTQVQAMGASLDWSRERFTLDEGLINAVRIAFVKLYKDGLITKGPRVVNWCPRCASTLADDEVIYIEEKTPFYYFTYGPVVIGTARPETKFGDKTIVVHPSDERYAELVGKSFDVPWILGTVQANVITDHAMDKEFGTGAMTITPAHSHEDFALAQMHNLPIVQIIDEAGNLTDAAGEFAGRNARAVREELVERMREKGLVHHIDTEYVHNLSVCYRCETPIEPLLSDQWFVRVDAVPKNGGPTLKQRALAVMEPGDGHIDILPERFEKTYQQWIGNLRDWCISRQIWWGHQIPVWTKGKKTYVGVKAPTGDGWEQDPSTLDTWFSSGLWTFSTLGWPKKTRELTAFHPTSVIETGYDIIFFWVARMILLTTYLTDEIPFKTVYLHGLVRTRDGQKMSKSLGNIIDPLEMIERYGADAVRLSLLLGTTPGNDTAVYEEKIAGYRNFVNKLWNVSRFIEMASEKVPKAASSKTAVPKTLADRWIASKTARLAADVSSALDSFKLAEAGQLLYDFLWSDFADWYLEASKAQRPNVRLLRYVLRTYLKLAHPFIPFVTEEIWRTFGFDDTRVKTTVAARDLSMLVVTTWPAPPATWIDLDAEATFEGLRTLISEIRTAASEHGVTYRRIAMSPLPPTLYENRVLLSTLAKLPGGVKAAKPGKHTTEHITALGGERLTVTAEYEEAAVDLKKVEAELSGLEQHIESLKAKLANETFTSKAPAQLVESTRALLADEEAKAETFRTQLGR